MAATFFITLREGLEAALIVGIIAAYLTKIGRSDALPRVWLGVAAALVVSVAGAIAVVLTVGRLPLVVQETFEGAAAVLAIVVLTWMLFWMRRQGRALKGDLEHSAADALERGTTTALVGLAFVAVLREGLETALFLLAIGSSVGDRTPALIGGVAGLAGASLMGWAIFRAGIRIDLRRFFSITGIVLIFVAAGLGMFAVAEFTEAGLIPPAAPVLDLSGLLTESSPIGSVLAGMFGYRSQPTLLQVAVYLLYLVPVLSLFLWGGRSPKRGAVAASAMVVAALVAGVGK